MLAQQDGLLVALYLVVVVLLRWLRQRTDVHLGQGLQALERVLAHAHLAAAGVRPQPHAIDGQGLLLDEAFLGGPPDGFFQRLREEGPLAGSKPVEHGAADGMARTQESQRHVRLQRMRQLRALVDADEAGVHPERQYLARRIPPLAQGRGARLHPRQVEALHQLAHLPGQVLSRHHSLRRGEHLTLRCLEARRRVPRDTAPARLLCQPAGGFFL
uniref:hypothetical protein n=1 Tax=Corallococcus coralloides TaxID=184914 RepID=UPI000FFECEFA|nr:hypothetical protein [Corallococcus coralloides]